MSKLWPPHIRAAVELGLAVGDSHSAIARRLGIRRESVRVYEQSKTRIAPSATETFRVNVRIKPKEPDEPVRTVVAIGDHHDRPGRDKTRALWLGRFCSDKRPDAIVSIGDWASLCSLSTHEIPGSKGDADRPAFHEELESLQESLSLFQRDIGAAAEAPLFHVHGNHEHRAWRAADRQPKLNGDLPIRLDQVFSQFGWVTKPFGQFLDLFGVNFVHVPLSVMGKEMGGENVERNVANKTLKSTVFGHTHRANVHTAVKVGQNQAVTVINLGTSMPYGVIEKYTGTAPSGWSYGAWVLRIQSGRIIGWKFFDMLELESTYS